MEKAPTIDQQPQKTVLLIISELEIFREMHKKMLPIGISNSTSGKIQGLKSSVRLQIKAHYPTDINTAVKLAETFDNHYPSSSQRPEKKVKSKENITNVEIGGSDVLALIDSGALTEIISKELVKLLELKTTNLLKIDFTPINIDFINKEHRWLICHKKLLEFQKEQQETCLIEILEIDCPLDQQSIEFKGAPEELQPALKEYKSLFKNKVIMFLTMRDKQVGIDVEKNIPINCTAYKMSLKELKKLKSSLKELSTDD
ncbi:hypothetical protein BB561_001249 [Smittium simulii]|uniref:Uncharacterized protein n=1 Tax=Smittium simulii TaxID=133385 RepID=A0A2T9YVG1_9FUNG|nr:hypothetical protein BB561_001249 [Smittium simulii]